MDIYFEPLNIAENSDLFYGEDGKGAVFTLAYLNVSPTNTSAINFYKKHGPGYRLYYGIHNDEIILLLMGGNKRTQKIDIEKAKNHWEQWQEEHDEN